MQRVGDNPIDKLSNSQITGFTEDRTHSQIVVDKSFSSMEFSSNPLPPELIKTVFEYLDVKSAWNARAVSCIFYTTYKETGHQKRLTKAAVCFQECMKKRIQGHIPWSEIYLINPFTYPHVKQDIRFVVDRFENPFFSDEEGINIKEAQRGIYLYRELRAALQVSDAVNNTQKLRWQIEVRISHEELSRALSTHFSRNQTFALHILRMAKLPLNIADTLISFSIHLGLQVARGVADTLSLSDVRDNIQTLQNKMMDALERRNRSRFDAFFDDCWRDVIKEIIQKKAVSIECVCDELQRNFPPITAFDASYGTEYTLEQEEFIRCLFGQPELSSFLYEEQEVLNDVSLNQEEHIE